MSLLLMMMLALGGPAFSSPSDPNVIFQQAEQADHGDHDYARAMALYRRIVEEMPSARVERVAETRLAYLSRGSAKGEEPLRRFEIVRENWAHSDHPAAEREVRAIAGEFPAFPLMDDLLMWLGDRASAAERWEEAKSSYRELLARFPDSPQRGFAAAGLGHACFATRDWDGAEKAFRQIAASGIPGASMIARDEQAMLARHILRRKYAAAAGLVLALCLLLGMFSVVPREVPRMAYQTLRHELLYIGPVLAFMVLVAPGEHRVDIAWVLAAGSAFLLVAGTWARSAAPVVARPASRALAVVLSLAAGVSSIYLAMYARDVLAAIEPLSNG